MGKNKQRPRWVRLLAVAAAVAALAAITVAAVTVGRFIHAGMAVQRDHHALRDRSDAHEIGKAMAEALRDPKMPSGPYGKTIDKHDPRMPESLRGFEVPYLYFLSLDRKGGRASLRFGGGFYSYGYEITLVDDGLYRLVCFGEEESDVVDLGTFEFQPRRDDAPVRPDVD